MHRILEHFTFYDVAAPAHWEGVRVLLAEDNLVNQETLSAVLDEFGLNVLPEKSGLFFRLFAFTP